MSYSNVTLEPGVRPSAGRAYGRVRMRPRSVSPLRRWMGIGLRLGLVLTPVVLVLVSFGIIITTVFGLDRKGIGALPPARPSDVVVDPYHQLRNSQKAVLTRQLLHLNRALQSDWMVVVLPKTNPRELQSMAEKLYQRWQLGAQGFNRRGALMLISNQPKQMAWVMGEDLQRSFGRTLPLYNAHFGDFIASQPLKMYMEQDRLADGMIAALNLIESHFAGETEVSTLAEAALSEPSETEEPLIRKTSSSSPSPMQSSLVLPPEE